MKDKDQWIHELENAFRKSELEVVRLRRLATLQQNTIEEYRGGANKLANLALEEAATLAQSWGGAPPSPLGSRAALARAIRLLKDGKYYAEPYDTHQSNIGAEITARKLQEVAEV